MKLYISKKKVSLKDIVEPKTSRSTKKVLNSALKNAYKDQQTTLKKAYSK